jgi:Family of unknown function (DUF5565)
MKKIPTLYLRDFTEPSNGRYVTREAHPDCRWVLDGEGAATRKYDGTCCMSDGERWWARREVKPGKSAPAGFVLVETDDVTGKAVGWEPVEQSGFAKWHADALRDTDSVIAQRGFPAGTYELVGPKINGNPEKVDEHNLWAHSAAVVLEPLARDFDSLAAFLKGFDGEGIVWHHPDGRMAKLKRRDFPAVSS